MKNENTKNKKKKNSKPHFTCEIEYSPDQDWRTDFILGQRGAKSHGHMALSGSQVLYLRDEQGKELIVDGNIITKHLMKNNIVQN